MSELWNILYKIRVYDGLGANKEADLELANHINSIEDLMNISDYITSYARFDSVLPFTAYKIRDLCITNLNSENIEWSLLRRFYPWFNDTIKNSITEKWLTNEQATDIDDFDIFINGSVCSDNPKNIDVLKKLLKIYSSRKSQKITKMVENLFKMIGKDYISDACEIISESTPAISVILLSRMDVQDKYTLKGLQSISKLSRQRNVEVKIELSMLENLGPRSRLEAMKQLLGMFDAYVQYKKQMDDYQKQNGQQNYYRSNYVEQKLKNKSKEYTLPFKTVPQKEEIEKFLFPCALKYNEEVSNLLKRYNQLEELTLPDTEFLDKVENKK